MRRLFKGGNYVYDSDVYTYKSFEDKEIDMLMKPNDAYLILARLYKIIEDELRISGKNTNHIRRLITIRFTNFSNDDDWLDFVRGLYEDQAEIEHYFSDYVKQWQHLASSETDSDGHRCVCTQLKIKKLAYVCCKENGNVLLIGSTCINEYGFKEVIEDSDISKNSKTCNKCGNLFQNTNLFIVSLKEGNGDKCLTKRYCPTCYDSLEQSGVASEILKPCDYCGKPTDGRQRGNPRHSKCQKHCDEEDFVIGFGKDSDLRYKKVIQTNPGYYDWVKEKLPTWGRGSKSQSKAKKFVKWVEEGKELMGEDFIQKTNRIPQAQSSNQLVINFGDTHRGEHYWHLFCSTDSETKKWIKWIRSKPPQKQDDTSGSYCHFYNWLGEQEKKRTR